MFLFDFVIELEFKIGGLLDLEFVSLFEVEWGLVYLVLVLVGVLFYEVVRLLVIIVDVVGILGLIVFLGVLF